MYKNRILAYFYNKKRILKGDLVLNYEKIENINLKEKFVQDFSKIFNEIIEQKGVIEPTFLCVGTDRITGDCFGPLVGSKLIDLLQEYTFSNINVYGSLKKNLDYENISKIIKKINNKETIIVIDAALSNKENIGKIFVSNKKTILGKGLDKNKIEIGDISIKTVVAKDYKIPRYNFKSLQNISLNGVMTLANIVAEGICEVIKSY